MDTWAWFKEDEIKLFKRTRMQNFIKMQKKEAIKYFLIFYNFFLLRPSHFLILSYSLFSILSEDLNDNTMTYMRTLWTKEIKEQIKLRTQRLLHKSRLLDNSMSPWIFWIYTFTVR